MLRVSLPKQKWVNVCVCDYFGYLVWESMSGFPRKRVIAAYFACRGALVRAGCTPALCVLGTPNQSK